MINGQIDNYTISVYTLIENKFDFGLNDYEIFDENYRPFLNNAILNYYMFHEIGFINPSIFRHYLKQKMDLIMRNVFNKLYKQRLIEFNPLYNLDSTETYKRDVENEGVSNSNNKIDLSGNTNSKTNSTSKNNSKDENDTSTDNVTNSKNNALALNSAYPSQEMKEGDWDNGIYVNSGQKQTNNANSTDKTNSNSKNITDSESKDNSETSLTDSKNTTNVGKVENSNNMSENYTRTLKGSSAMLTPSRAMIEFEKYVKSFNLDKQVIDSLSDLFINIY